VVGLESARHRIRLVRLVVIQYHRKIDDDMFQRQRCLFGCARTL
jgi:hypothetical protein